VQLTTNSNVLFEITAFPKTTEQSLISFFFINLDYVFKHKKVRKSQDMVFEKLQDNLWVIEFKKLKCVLYRKFRCFNIINNSTCKNN